MAYEHACNGKFNPDYEQGLRPETKLGPAYEALRSAIELSDAVKKAANDICGSVPNANTPNKLESVSDGVIGELSNRSKEASRSISEAHEAILRICLAFGV